MLRPLIVFLGLILSACSPANQEDCIASAAKEAKTPQGLNLLTDVCRTKFPAKLSSEGKYIYYDPDLNMNFEVSGPTLSPKDLEWIESTRQSANVERANNKAIQDTAKKNLKIVDYNISCDVDTTYIACYSKNITIKLKNNSNYTVSGVKFNYEIGNQLDCSGGLGKSFIKDIEILPQQTASIVHNVTFKNAGPDGVMSGCVKVGGVRLAE